MINFAREPDMNIKVHGSLSIPAVSRYRKGFIPPTRDRVVPGGPKQE
jgi:hypothetical protein